MFCSSRTSGIYCFLLRVDERVLRVLLDELAAAFHVFSHQHAEDLVGQRGVLELYANERPRLGVHRCSPQLFGEHLAQAFETRRRRRGLLALGRNQLVAFLVAENVVHLARAEADGVQRRLRRIHVSALDQRPHVPEQERQEQCADVSAVDVRVGQHHDLPVPALRHVHLFADAGADRVDQRADLLALEHLVQPSFLDVRDLAADRKDRLRLAAARGLRAAACRVALDDEQLGRVGIPRRTVGELAGQASAFERTLSRDVARLLRGLARLRRRDAFARDPVRFGGVLLQPVPQPVVHDTLDERADLGVPELRLRLAFELRLAELHAYDRDDALPDVFALEVLVFLFQVALLARVPVDDVRERLLEAFLVHPAFVGVDRVREGVQRVVVGRVPLDRDVGLPALLARRDTDDLVERLSAGVERLDEVGDPARRLAGWDVRRLLAMVGEGDRHPARQVRQLLEALREDVGLELQRLFEHLRVRPEPHRRSGALGRLAFGRLLHRAAARERRVPYESVAVDFHLQLRGQRVHDRHTDAVQASRDLVAAAAELPAGVQDGHDDLERGSLALVPGDRGDRDAGAVVADGNAPVVVEVDVYLGRAARQRLVDRVVDDLVDEVVEAAGSRRPDVHPGPLADGFETFEDLDVFARVLGAFRHAALSCSPPPTGDRTPPLHRRNDPHRCPEGAWFSSPETQS